jgi:hypothetical protein
MLLRLRTVSPQPPSLFWCSANQARPLRIKGFSWAGLEEYLRTRLKALTAVAVERAEVDNSPIQWLAEVRWASRAARAV